MLVEVTPSLAEIKAAAEAETSESYGRGSAQRDWLIERCEELAVFARRVSLLDPTVGLMDVHEMVADARDALARLEGGE